MEEGTKKYARARPFFTYSRGIQVSCLPDGVPSERKPFLYIVVFPFRLAEVSEWAYSVVSVARDAACLFLFRAVGRICHSHMAFHTDLQIDWSAVADGAFSFPAAAAGPPIDEAIKYVSTVVLIVAGYPHVGVSIDLLVKRLLIRRCLWWVTRWAWNFFQAPAASILPHHRVWPQWQWI